MSVIGNKEDMKEFFNELLVPLQDDWVYVVLGVARKKYANEGELTRSEEALAKEIIPDYDFDRFYRTLLKYEVSEDVYVDRNTRKPIPNSAKAYYIDLTPKSMSMALAKFFQDVMRDIIDSRTNPQALEHLRRSKSHLFGNLSKSDAIRKPYKIIDVDIKDNEVLAYVKNALASRNIPIKWISETRGGYHIIIQVGAWLQEFHMHAVPDIEKLNHTYNKIVIEIGTQCQTPIVGTYQGGFLVRRVIV